MNDRIINAEQGEAIINALEGIALAIPNSITNAEVTPTEQAQTITPPRGKLGFNEVNVAAIPPQYVNASGANAEAGDVLAGQVFVNGSGRQTGAMVDRGSVTQTIEPGGSYTIQPGHYSGGTITANGAPGANVTNLDVTPTESIQRYNAEAGGYDGYNLVNVGAIPSQYKNTAGTNAVAADVLAGQVFVNGSGQHTGTMVNRGAVTATVGSGDVYTIPEGYHNGAGTVTGTGGGYDGNIYINWNSTSYNVFGSNNSGVRFVINDGVTNTPHMFEEFYALNSPVEIPDSVINTRGMFLDCVQFNREINLYNKSIIDAYSMMYNCQAFNSPFILPNDEGRSGRNYSLMLYNCRSFDQPLNPIYAADMSGMLRNCISFNQNINVRGYGLSNLANLLANCKNYNAGFSFGAANCVYRDYIFANCIKFNSTSCPFGQNVRSMKYALSGCTNWRGTVYIRNNNITQANVVGLYARCNNSLRKNIYCNNIAVINGTTATTSVTATAITWTAITNGYYNSVYNIYIYKNY